MSTIYDWNKYINLLHEYAIVEDDLRTIVFNGGDSSAVETVLYERFGA